MCDSTNFHNIFFDSNNQPGLFTHPCISETDIKANRKMASGKDGIAMMTLARQNQVGTVMLHGVPIVCLYIEAQERLCLAQISNTLLKDYSYNEIHNRRVALGITCLQCTPVQLEILRRAGAMPVSSRRCGLITKREAERLVKSFLEDISPPQLPEDFKFEVYHECGWGSRGSFQPSRYNSSRAKCIECHLCKGFFSPNKFIFHYHRAPAATYRHPDAANFNSWRRHLKLCEQNPSDSLVHAWEDVKAMFNGGSRKRMLSSPMKSPSSPKMPSHAASSPAEDIGFYSFPPTPNAFPYYPYMSPMSDPLQMQRVGQGAMHPAFPRNVSSQRATTFQSYGDVLRSLSAPYTMMWMQQPTIPKPDNLNFFLRPCDMDSNITVAKPAKIRPIPEEQSKRDIGQDLMMRETNGKRAEKFDLEMADSSSPDSECFLDSVGQNSPFKTSAVKSSRQDIECRTANGEGDGIHITDDEGTIDVVAESQLPVEGLSESRSKSVIEPTDAESVKSCVRPEDESADPQEDRDTALVDSTGRISEPEPSPTEDMTKSRSVDQEVNLERNGEGGDSPVGTDVDMVTMEPGSYTSLPIDELQRLLARVRKARQHAEKRSKRLKGSLQDTLRREARIKHELTEQITAMRGTLCSEIEQEKRAKELIQQRLKGRPSEVHDAMQNISMGLVPGQSTNCLCRDDQSEDSISDT